MSFSSIDKPSKYFNTITYTGTSASNSRTVGFQPDFFWFKNRGGNYHVLGDSVRGITKFLYSNDTSAEVTNTTVISSLNSTGYTLGDNSNASERVNYSGDSMVSWNWLGSNTTVSNNSGSISSTVSANTTSGFSIVSYTGNGTSGATVGHGLGVTPKMFIIKSRGSAVNWRVYHASIGNTAGLALNTTGASDTNSGFFNNTSPSSTVFTLGDGSTVNSSSTAYIAYCFADVKGFSKAFSYTGNGSTDGTFVYCGFKPSFVMIKSSSNSGTEWVMHDVTRSLFNPMNDPLLANSAGTESVNASWSPVDFLSNGFKLRTTDTWLNASGGTYIGIAFAENPFVSSKGIPCTAR